MTFGTEHKFSGRVIVSGGQIESFKRIDVDTEREVLRAGRRGTVSRGPRGRVVAVRPGRGAVMKETTLDKIEQEIETTLQWQTKTDDNPDGVDFKVTALSTTLRLVLLIDGKPQSQEVEVGKHSVKATASPIVVQFKL